MAAMALSPDALMEEVLRQQPELADQGVTESLLRTTTFVMGGIVMAGPWWRWCSPSSPWAGVGVPPCADGLGRRERRALRARHLRHPGAALPAFASVITLAVLRRPDVKAWFANAQR